MLAKSCFFQPQDGSKSQHPVCWMQARASSTGGCQWVLLEVTCHWPPPFITAHSSAGLGWELKCPARTFPANLLVVHCFS